MNGSAKIYTDRNMESLVVPRKAFGGSVQQGNLYKIENDRVKLVVVQVGEIIDDMVIILAGIQEGDQLVTSGHVNLENGTKVKVIEDTKVRQ